MTDLAHGVRFDMEGNGSPTAIAWTAAGVQVAFLALGLNGTGVIDTGAEVFARQRGLSRPQGLLRPLPGGSTAMVEQSS